MDRLVFRVLVMALVAKGLEINTTNNKILEKAEGENVRLDCEFTTAPEDEGPLEIEWSMKSVRHPMEMAVVLLYTAGQIYDRLYEPLKGRVYFHSLDPEKGDAAIGLLLLTPKDSGIYKCQVKKVPEVRSIKTVLRVLKPPSKPRCYFTSGAGDLARSKVLHCGSEEGAAPMRYHWARLPPWKLLPISALMDKTAGTLTLKDASESDAGTYQCTVTNRVGEENCLLELELTHLPTVGTIAGSVTGGALAAIGMIAAITCIIVRHRRVSETSNETSNEILEDASPPSRRNKYLMMPCRSHVPTIEMSPI